ncbi:hypothetical protein ACEPAF_8622 [Sanghuangporus sanghuang]
MPFISLLSSTFHVFDTLVLSLTSHTRLTLASEPGDYDLILRRTIREVKFYSETLLAILLVAEKPALLSQTLACLMFTLITYIALEAMTGDSLHKRIDEIPCGRIVLACITKLPALSVLWTLAVLALSHGDSLATKIVLSIVAVVLLLGFAMRLGVHILFLDSWTSICRFCKGVGEGARGAVAGGRKRKLSDATVDSEGSAGDASHGKEHENTEGGSVMTVDECV